MKYKGPNIRLIKRPDMEDVAALFRELRETGANAVAINTFDYCYLRNAELTRPPSGWLPRTFIFPDKGQDPGHPFYNTTPVEDVAQVAKLAKDAGFARVILKPMIDSYYADWRGYISVAARAADWMFAYKYRFLSKYLPIVQEYDLDLVIGTELYTVTKELGPQFWIDILRWLRKTKRVRQRLTYAANWGPGEDGEYYRLRGLWDQLEIDYIGIDSYWPPQDWTAKPYSWFPPVVDVVRSLIAETGKPAWFTEVGFPRNVYALTAPLSESKAAPYPSYWEANLAYHELLRVWDDILEGRLVWEAGDGSFGVPDGTHNVHNTPLQFLAWGDRSDPL